MSIASTKPRFRIEGDANWGKSQSVHSSARFVLRRDGQYLHWSAKKLTASRNEGLAWD